MKTVFPDQVDQLKADKPHLSVIDVRGHDEVAATGHIPGADVLPLQDIPHWAGQLEKDQPYLLVCKAGVRSAHACEYLEEQGFTELYNLGGGMAAWEGELAHEQTANR